MKLWSLKDDKITRTYTARNFQVSWSSLYTNIQTAHIFISPIIQSAMNSLVSIGQIAERENHHPDLHLTGYRNVSIVLHTHSLGGLSQNDIEVAKMIDSEVDFDYSPQWLKNHPEANKK
jgi:pterin-4a-carbinolamine dehydratase